jgi:hypothetical protein
LTLLYGLHLRCYDEHHEQPSNRAAESSTPSYIAPDLCFHTLFRNKRQQFSAKRQLHIEFHGTCPSSCHHTTDSATDGLAYTSPDYSSTPPQYLFYGWSGSIRHSIRSFLNMLVPQSTACSIGLVTTTIVVAVLNSIGKYVCPLPSWKSITLNDFPVDEKTRPPTWLGFLISIQLLTTIRFCQFCGPRYGLGSS